MDKIQNILVIDDHPMNRDAYINLIQSTYSNRDFNFFKAIDCCSSEKIITQFKKISTSIDVALIDISIPACIEKKLFSGTDVAVLIRNTFPNCSIIMLTMHTESLILLEAYKKVNPEGLISKNDIDFKTFPQIFSTVLQLGNYLSPSIKIILKKAFKDYLKWDEIDIQIILLLQKGIHTKDLPKYIQLSLSSIEKRKAILKSNLLDRKGTDTELIEKCKQLELL